MANIGAILGAGFGTGVGAFLGNILGKKIADSEVKKIPINSVYLNWEEPLYEDNAITNIVIPEDHYVKAYLHTTERQPRELCIKKPVRDEKGNTIMKTVSRTFSDHGKPSVEWETKQILNPLKFSGVNVVVKEDYHYEEIKDSDGKVIREERETDGFYVNYHPKLESEAIGEFKVPKVIFENKVKSKEITTTCTILGGGIGGLIGGFLGYLLPA